MANESTPKKFTVDPQVRAAVLKNHGGWGGADDEAIDRLWRSLDEKTQAKYLESLQEKEEKADDSSQP